MKNSENPNLAIIESAKSLIETGVDFTTLVDSINKELGSKTMRFRRQVIIQELTGERLGVVACSPRAVAKRLWDKYAPDGAVPTEKVKVAPLPKASKTVKPTIVEKSTEGVKADKKATAKIKKAKTTETVEATNQTDAAKSSVVEFDTTGTNLVFRADLQEELSKISSDDFKAFVEALPEGFALVSRRVKKPTRLFTMTVSARPEVTLLDENKKQIGLTYYDKIANFFAVVSTALALETA